MVIMDMRKHGDIHRAYTILSKPRFHPVRGFAALEAVYKHGLPVADYSDAPALSYVTFPRRECDRWNKGFKHSHHRPCGIPMLRYAGRRQGAHQPP